MKSKNLIIILIIVIIILTFPVTILAINYYNYLYAPAKITTIEGAPGCTKCEGGEISCMLPPGGCGGTSRIDDLKIEGNSSCLGVFVENCQGGELRVFNKLLEPFTIDGIELKGNQTSYIELYKDDDNKVKVRELVSNFPKYFPEQNTTLSITLPCQGQEMIISYVKTKKLCE